MNKVFDKETLYQEEGQRRFDQHCSEAAFLIGGIGTGNFSVGARGELRAWEIFNRSGKDNYMPNGFFALWVKAEGQSPLTKVLESQMQPPYSKSHGFVDYEVGGLPRFSHSQMTAEYPFVQVKLWDEDMPVEVTMECFNPFIPLNSKDSGLPCGIIRYRVKNIGNLPLDVSVVGSLTNMTTLVDYDRHTWNHFQRDGEGINVFRKEEGLSGIYFSPKNPDPNKWRYGSMALATPEESVSYKRAWLNSGWWDGLQDMWDDFCQDGRLEAESVYKAKDVDYESPDATASLAIHKWLEPGEEQSFDYYLSWYFPYRVDCWSEGMFDQVVRPKNQAASCCGEQPAYPYRKKFYATQFSDAWAVTQYLAQHWQRLYGHSLAFRRAFFASTLPSYVLDAVAANITVLRSQTCFRLEDGTLMGWEGCFEDEGCCEGNCTHVWNYAQTVAFLFPDLERSMRRLEYGVETKADGKMNFRSYQLWGMEGHDHVPAADGQLGTFVRFYREWKLSGDNDFLRELWPRAKKTLDYAFSFWDKDGDLVLETNTFNTYDIAFQGPSSMINSLFFAALKAGAEMAGYLGDEESAGRYEAAFALGSKRMDELLWGGEYYIQQVADPDEYRYQYGDGCLSDQIFGQTLAHLTGLGYVLPKDHVKKAVKAVFDNNFALSMAEHHNLQRTYALNNEAGLLLCTWPKGNRPKLPFPYSDEVWTGIEYQVATHLIYEGYIDEGLTLVKNLRDRHDGIRRNPWDEVECGHHYVRAMASFGLLVALSGFTYDLPQGKIAFAPKINQADFHCFYITGKSWGIYSSQEQPDGSRKQSIQVLYGSQEGVKLDE